MNKLFIYLFIIFYYYYIINPLEKKLYLYYFNRDKRPLDICVNDNTFKCLGMPSGHTEIATIISLLLLNNNIIQNNMAYLLIIITGIQRIIFKIHTVNQVFIGFSLGLIYSYIFIKFNNHYIILVIFLISFLYLYLLISKIDYIIKNERPIWFDNSLEYIIDKKVNIPYIFKIKSIINVNELFMDWNTIENYLNEIINQLTNTNIKYDAVVGIKSGGAILANYIAYKLNIPKYYIKTSYDCNKLNNNFLDMLKLELYENKLNKKYTICETIDNDISNQNIILIDDFIESGSQMKTSINYLKTEKQVLNVTPVVLHKPSHKEYNFKLLYATNIGYDITAWGYDN